MKHKASIMASAAAAMLALSACSLGAVDGPGVQPVAQEPVAFVEPPARDPSELQVLFWNDEQRSARFRAMENWFPGHEVPAATTPRELRAGEPLPASLAQDIRRTMIDTGAAGVMVWEDGGVRFEDYALGFTPDQRWTSFSVAKSFTSTLLGAALKDGFIASLDDPVTRYVPGLAGSAYDDVTVRQVATMTSGAAWNEDYTDPESDVAQLARFTLEYGEGAIVEQMKRLEREAPPGEKFVYKTGETNLLGLIIENAVGLPLAAYAQEKIVEPAGFAGGLFWMNDQRGGNIGGCCLSLRLSDYTRMGIFALEGGGTVVPEGWFAEAGDSQVDFPSRPGFGYGYQWWTYPQGYGAQGIFGQSITILPEQDLVITIVGNWPTATGPNRDVWFEMIGRISAAE
ncbi:serine hydrolase domain-containing protein [Erythrobacter sp.]|jgi:CubicO group peptidase (beta-lactamase class C family)|uniref:serine hydrolase domain-containing protein n=1 Tax=Erythrobacter sp. TaxID=1042 RepID=UPI002E9B8CE0|nr:serine hydrolase domain-containing protein [Erythrobacter sp.]